MSLFNRAVRDQRWVNRWGTIRRLKEQSIAEHQYFVALYFLQICRDLEISYVQDAWGVAMWKVLTHDLPEIITSDTPGPVKRALNAEGISAWVEDQLSNRIPNWKPPSNVTVREDEEMDAIMKVADDFEAAMYIMDEASMGNKNVKDVQEYVRRKLSKSLRALIRVLPDREEKILSMESHMNGQLGSNLSGEYPAMDEDR